MKKLSLSLKIFVLFEILIGLLGVILSFFWFLWIWSSLMMNSEGHSVDANPPYTILIPFKYLFFSILFPSTSLIAGVGILQKKTWAWKFNIYILPSVYLLVFWCIYLFCQESPKSIICFMINSHIYLIPPIIFIFLLNSSFIKQQFNNNKSTN